MRDIKNGFKFSFSLLCFILISNVLFGLKSPEIEPTDVSIILRQIMDAHVFHKKLSPTLVKRALEEYLEVLDPTKTYLLHSEIQYWLDLQDPQLTQLIEEINNNEFSEFFKIHDLMNRAIIRRNQFEAEICLEPYQGQISLKEFKDLSWAKTDVELKDRLKKIKTIQTNIAEKLSEESKEKTLQRIQKRRASLEEKFISPESKIREQFILSNILRAFANSFDAHTSYFTPSEAKQFMIQVQQRLFGIGAQLRDDLNGFTIVKIIEGGPASHSLLKAKDLVIAIDEEPVIGMCINDVVELIRGEEGTGVNLTVIREEEEIEKTLKIPIIRGEVVIQEARLESELLPFGEGVIALLKLHSFYQDPNHSAAIDLSTEIGKIKKDHKLKGIILDLRQNVGGVLTQAVAVTGLFITKGIVVSIKDNRGHIEHLREIDGKTVWDGPLIILISKISASAAEIVAQTLQDYGRAIILGDPHTFGKGTFQTFTLDAGPNSHVNPKGEFKVTRGRYYTVSGKSPQLVGVIPDIIIPGPYSHIEIGEQYAKYPLENDSIEPHFNDDLSDIPLPQREQISWFYKFNLQTKLKTFNRFIPILQKNLDTRMTKNVMYQRFLEEIKKEDNSDPPLFLETLTEADLQLVETIELMKDLIILTN